MFNQKGFANVLVLLFLLAGLGTGLILVQNPQIFNSQAFSPRNSMVTIPTSSGNPRGEHCSIRVTQFSVSEVCNSPTNGFRSAKFICSDEVLERSLGDEKTCSTAERLFAQATIECRRLCVSPTPSPLSSCSPKLSCPKSNPNCLIAEPPGGWCASPAPTSSPSCAPGIIDCAAPPQNCQYVGGTSCYCGTIVCSSLK